MLKKLSPEQVLARKIQVRRAFLKRVVSFVMDIVDERGRQTRYEEGNFHTHVVRKLEAFAGFSFETDLGQSSMGGNDITIWHRGNREDGMYLPVLKVRWQAAAFNPNKCEVNLFAESGNWQTALKRVMRNKVKIIEKMAKAEKAAEARQQKALLAEKEREALQTAAKRLGIS